MGNLSLTFKFFSMKKMNIWVPVITGIAGLLIGAVLTFGAIHLFGQNYSITDPCPPTLTQTQVNSYMNKYLSSAKPYQGVIKGFNVNAQEVNAWTCLLKNNSLLASFRAYKGIDEKGDSLLIVVGVDNAGKDDKSMYYRVVPVNGGPCPPICDKN